MTWVHVLESLPEESCEPELVPPGSGSLESPDKVQELSDTVVRVECSARDVPAMTVKYSHVSVTVPSDVRLPEMADPFDPEDHDVASDVVLIFVPLPRRTRLDLPSEYDSCMNEEDSSQMPDWSIQKVVTSVRTPSPYVVVVVRR